MKYIPSLMLVGGFLGAGKTTAILALSKILTGRGQTTAAITNDQAAGLVDTAFLRGNGLATQEVTGSCFCCNFDGFSQAITKSIEGVQPDIILAEPVGSCTDIVATVIRPMLNLMGNKLKPLAYSVLVEPQRWVDLTDKESNEPSSIKFLFDKQLEEADFIVVTKADTRTPDELEKLLNNVRRRCPDATVLAISAKEGIGLDKWLDLMLAIPPGEKYLKEINYDQYAEAEADMGWLNTQVSVKFSEPVDGNNFAVRLADDLRSGIAERSGCIGNLKILAVGASGTVKCGMSHIEDTPQLEGRFANPLANVNATINVRATLSPDDLSSIVRSTVDRFIEQDRAAAKISYLNTFRPSPPKPTYRYNKNV